MRTERVSPLHFIPRNLRVVLPLVLLLLLGLFLLRGSSTSGNAATRREPIDMAATEKALERIRDTATTGVDITFIVPHYRQTHLLSQAIDSIFDGGFDDYEIFVINDSGSATDVELYHEYAERYAAKYPSRVFYVSPSEENDDTQFEDEGLNADGEPITTTASLSNLLSGSGFGVVSTNFQSQVAVDIEPSNTNNRIQEGPAMHSTRNRVVFLNKPFNSGLAATRNYGIQYATGLWICPLDADDWFQPGIAASFQRFLDQRRETWKSTLYDVIISDLGTATSVFQPLDDPLIDIRIQNRFHVSGFFRRNLAQKQHYRNLFYFGWEDWDFWLNVLSRSPTLKIGFIREPLVFYSVGSMHHYCGERRAMCTNLFRLANSEIYSPAQVLASTEALLEVDGVVINHHHGFGQLVERHGSDPIVILWNAIYLAARGTPAAAQTELARIMPQSDSHTWSNFMFLTAMLAERTSPARPSPDLRAQYKHHCGLTLATSQLSEEWRRVELCSAVRQTVLFHAVDATLFHYVFHGSVLNSADTQTYLLSLDSLFRHNAHALVVMHLENTSEIPALHQLLVEKLKYSVIFSPICTDYFAALTGHEALVNSIRRSLHDPDAHANEMTELYRLFVLAELGGSMLRPNVLALTTLARGARNSMATRTWAPEMKADRADGRGFSGDTVVDDSFLSFERRSLFIMDLLSNVAMDSVNRTFITPFAIHERAMEILPRRSKPDSFFVLQPPNRFLRPVSSADLDAWAAEGISDELWDTIFPRISAIVIPLQGGGVSRTADALRKIAGENSLLERAMRRACDSCAPPETATIETLCNAATLPVDDQVVEEEHEQEEEQAPVETETIQEES